MPALRPKQTMTPETESQPEAPADTPTGEGLVSLPCSAPAFIRITQDGMDFSSSLDEPEDWEILEAVLKRVRNRQNTQDDLPR